MPAPENMTTTSTPFSLSSATISEVDVTSVTSFKTVETNHTQDQERISSDFARTNANDSQEIIKMLCELDGGLGIALERVKQDATSAKEMAIFLKKRAAIEDEYGRSMIKLAKNFQDSYTTNDTKQGSYGDNWINMLKLHESIGENRIKFASAIQEISEDASILYKDTDRTRKNLKDSGNKHEKAIQDSETALEKARGKYESHSEDWERTILQKNGDIPPSSKPRTLTKAIFSKSAKSPTQLVKMEEDARNKAEAANETYRQHLSATNATRHQYYEVHLPNLIKALKETADECDVGLQYQLARYSYLFENTMVSDALVIAPVNEDDGPAIRKIVEQINNETDFHSYVQSFSTRARKVKNSDIPYDQYNMSEQAANIMNPKNIFGIDLAEQMHRDGYEIPLILAKCCEAIERNDGLQSQGLYRIPGVTSQIQRLRMLFDRNAETFDFNFEEQLSDVNNITSLVKLWFRELPDPLFTREMYQDFINAAKNTDDKRRVLELHDRVNKLPDANYSTLKYFMGHLDRVVKNQEYNKMSVQSIGIIFGPTLMGNPISGGPNSPLPQSLSGISYSIPQNDVDDMGWQCKVVETILMKYHAIFVME